jgi:hypothetical protein
VRAKLAIRKMVLHCFRALTLIAAACLGSPRPTSGTAAEIKVLKANALTIAMKKSLPAISPKRPAIR